MGSNLSHKPSLATKSHECTCITVYATCTIVSCMFGTLSALLLLCFEKPSETSTKQCYVPFSFSTLKLFNNQYPSSRIAHVDIFF